MLAGSSEGAGVSSVSTVDRSADEAGRSLLEALTDDRADRCLEIRNQIQRPKEMRYSKQQERGIDDLDLPTNAHPSRSICS